MSSRSSTLGVGRLPEAPKVAREMERVGSLLGMLARLRQRVIA